MITALTISILVYYALNLFKHFSGQHLIAQYALELGIGSPDGPDAMKDKMLG